MRTLYGDTDWFRIGKGVRQGCILSPVLFNLYAEMIMRKSDLHSSNIGVKIGGRTINNLRYADDTTLLAEREDDLLNLILKIKKESEKFSMDLLLKLFKKEANDKQKYKEEVKEYTNYLIGRKIP